MAVINQNVISLFRTKQVLRIPFYSGLAADIAQGYQSTSPLLPTATRGGGGGPGNNIIGFIFDREITTREILIRDFAFYSC